MKGLMTILLIVIASGVAYLAFSEYQKRQVVQAIAEEISNPYAKLTDQWTNLANLRCDNISEVQIENDPTLGRIPKIFKCGTSQSEFWLLTQLPYEECNSLPRTASSNAKYPENEGEVFHGSGIVCWSASKSY
jgi:LPS O-antigen subunit length determinant protein (WzzB/FepE family)